MLLSKGLNDKLKMKVKNADGNMTVVECSVSLLLNKLKTAEAMILSIKK